VPVEMPQGVSYEGVFGQANEQRAAANVQAVGGLAYKSASPLGLAAGWTARDAAAPGPPSPRRENAQAMEAERRPRVRTGPETDDFRGDVDRSLARPKLHAALASIVQRHQQGALQLSGQESRFVQDGKATVEIWLADATEELLLQIKQLGFEQLEDARVAKILSGRIAIDKLTALASLSGVRYVNPLAR